ncbi:MAG TPA: septal ring lytic transglycosylase RlpA family protein [Actinomycetota bacterium]|nr:septal ring lytic transglycosylase RlpA family protein [Actinomycetota bacterium]
MRRHPHSRRVLAATIGGALLFSLTAPATAHRPKHWRYEKRIRNHKAWQDHQRFRVLHRRWHEERLATVSEDVPQEDGTTLTVTRTEPTYTEAEHRRFHHRLRHRHLKRHHRYRVVARQRGRASWYDYEGRVGACGKVLKGMYAAHRTWPCGSKVAVKRGGRVVVVRVLDRGPFVDGWVIDLAPRAFRKVGGLGEGVVPVKIFRLKKR